MSTLTAQTHSNNSVSLEFVPDTIKKGTSVGNPILRPNLKSLNDEQLVGYIGGPEKVRKLLERYVSQNAAVASREAFDDKTATIDLEDWNKLISGVSIAGETLDELRDRLDEVKDNALKIADEYMESEPTRQAELKLELGKLKEEKAQLEKSIAEKEEIGKKRVAARKANELAKTQNAPEAAAA